MKTSEMFINSAINSFFHQWSEIDSDLSDGIFFPNSRLVQSTLWAKIWRKKWHLAFSQQFEILSEKAALMEAEESKEKMFSNVDYT